MWNVNERERESRGTQWMKFLIIARAEKVSHRFACTTFFSAISKTRGGARDRLRVYKLRFRDRLQPICSGPDGRVFTKQRDKYFLFFRCNARARAREDKRSFLHRTWKRVDDRPTDRRRMPSCSFSRELTWIRLTSVHRHFASKHVSAHVYAYARILLVKTEWN